MNYLGIPFEMKYSSAGGKLVLNLNFFERAELVTDEIAKTLQDNLRAVLVSMHYSPKFVESVLNATKIEATPHSVVVTVEHPVFPYLELGTRPRVMRHLLGKVVPIKRGSRVIFRKATERSFLRGGWRHPGTPARYLLGRAVVESLREAVEYVRVQLPAFVGGIAEWLRRAISSRSTNASQT